MCVRLVLPVYFTSEMPREDDLSIARKCWNHILDDTSPAFIAKKADPEFTDPSCLVYFYTIFYNRLFCVHPSCRPMFRDNLQVQGKALARILSFILQPQDDKEKFNKIMEDMAQRHVDRGVRAHEYAMLGEVLFYALRQSLGPAVFDVAAAQSWIRIYSLIISVVVPFHVRHELKIAAEKAAAHSAAAFVVSGNHNTSEAGVSLASTSKDAKESMSISTSTAAVPHEQEGLFQ